MSRALDLAILLAFAFHTDGWAAPAHSELTAYSRRIWQMQDGLPRDTVYSIAQSKDHYLWIGTIGGLARFDGSRFTTYDRSNTTAFLDDNILSLFAATSGDLWIGTVRGGLVQFSNGQFRRLAGEPTGPIHSILQDASGLIWVGGEAGLFQARNGRLVRWAGPNAFAAMGVTALYEDAGRQLWVGGRGLWKLVSGTPSWVARPDADLRMRTIARINDGTMWFGAARGLFRFDGAQLIATAFQPPGDPAVLSLREDHEGNLWIGMFGGGLARYRNGRYEVFRGSANLPDNLVQAVFEDVEENLWIGTQGGLMRLSPVEVTTLTMSHGLSDENIRTLYQDHTGVLWLVTYNGVLHRVIDGRAQQVHLPCAAGLPKLRIALRDRQGLLWVGVTGKGLLSIDGNRTRSFTKRDGLSGNDIRCLMEDHEGALWVGTERGLDVLRGRKLRNIGADAGWKPDAVRSLFEDHAGDIWVAAAGGLSRFHQGRFVQDTVTSALQGQYIWAMHQDAEGALWLGTNGNGLYRILNGRLAHLSLHQALPDNTIYQILPDNSGGLWMSSNSGVFGVRLRDLNAMLAGEVVRLPTIQYGTAEGMPARQMVGGGVQPIASASRAGLLWFGSVKGAVAIDSTRRRRLPAAPVFFERLTVDGRDIPLRKSAVAPPGSGRVEVEYTAIGLRSPERLRFQYKLEGFDTAWNEAGSRTALYTNLPPGSYRLRVMAVNSDGFDSPSEASLSFRLQPHYYQTAVFYCLCAIMIVALLVMGLLLHGRRTRMQYAMVLAERNRLAREMHDTLIQGCVGAATLLEAVHSCGQPTGAIADLLDRTRIQIRMTLNEAREAIWDMRHQALDGGSVSSLLERFASILSQQTGVSIETAVEGSLANLSHKQQHALLLVAKEALRNAVKHGRPAQVLVQFRCSAGEVVMYVTDNGCGFDIESMGSEPTRHYGLVGMRERVEQAGGRLTLESSLGCGTRVTAAIPRNPVAANGTAA
jgi:ligand-binding sensor domain-containing protein/signal transduction histidine kinase